MKQSANIKEIALLQPDFMGFIFYPKSPRYAKELDIDAMKSIPEAIRKTGVFVNETIETILNTGEKYQLNAIQLHGCELPEMCKSIQDKGYICLKAFPIERENDLENTCEYEAVVDYFLFDTKTNAYGGSGEKFDWEIINHYRGKKPFFISGGIGVEDIERIKSIRHPLLYGIDINSRFESSPGMKNREQVKQFIQTFKK